MEAELDGASITAMNREKLEPGANSRVVLGGLVVLFLGFPLVDVVLFGFGRIFQYLAGDAFYYLTIAANFPETGILTYDQSLPTNGFHPLWQVVLAAVAEVLQYNSEPRANLILASFALSLVLANAGLLLAARRTIHHLDSCDFLLLFAPMGFALLGAGWFSPRRVTLWSQINGMESGLAIFFFGVLVYLMLDEDSLIDRRPIVIGLVVGFLVLSRLDLVFFFPAIALTGCAHVCSANRESRKDLGRRYLLLLGVGSALVLSYGVINLMSTGELLPASARFKSTFPRIDRENLTLFAYLWRAFVDPLPRAQKLFWLCVANALPFLIAVVEIIYGGFLWRRSSRLGPWSRLLLMLALALVGSHLFNILFVSRVHQGHWYFGVSQISTILILAGWIARSSRIRKFLTGRTHIARAFAFTVSATFFVTIYLSLNPVGPVDNPEDEDDFSGRYFYTFQERREVREFYGGSLPKIVEFDDGIIAFSFGGPTLSGMRVCLDPEGVRYLLREGMTRQVLWLAYERGYDRVASSGYLNIPMIYEQAPSAELTRFLHWIPARDDLTSFRWEVEYVSHRWSFFILRFEPMDRAAFPESEPGMPGRNQATGR